MLKDVSWRSSAWKRDIFTAQEASLRLKSSHDFRSASPRSLLRRQNKTKQTPTTATSQQVFPPPRSFPSVISRGSQGAADLWLPRLAVTNLIQQIIAEYELLSSGQPRCRDLLPGGSG